MKMYLRFCNFIYFYEGTKIIIFQNFLCDQREYVGTKVKWLELKETQSTSLSVHEENQTKRVNFWSMWRLMSGIFSRKMDCGYRNRPNQP